MKNQKDEDQVGYWLFQLKPNIIDLKAALRAEKLTSFVVKNNRKKMKIGDRVILWQTGKQGGCYALGTIQSEVAVFKLKKEEQLFYKTYSDKDYRVKLKLDYNLWNRPITKELLTSHKSFNRFYAGLPGTNYVATALQFQALEKFIEEDNIIREPFPEYLQAMQSSLSLNTILYGPPGTGKTYHTINYALSILENRSLEELLIEDRAVLKKRFESYEQTGQIHYITFHQSFAYEDFVEGIKPFTEEKKVYYSVEDGIFKEICLKAQLSNSNEVNQAQDADETNCRKYVLIIDEINRGNIANIFGELITLIEADKRAGMPESMSVLLPYSKSYFSVPANIYLLGTMNTADRSIEALDLALRRRFNFIEMRPDPSLISKNAEKALTAGIHLEKLLQAMNRRIELLLNKDYCIGHAYFMHLETIEQIKMVFENRIIPLLKEYFFGDYAKIGLVLGRAFLKEKKLNSTEIFADFEHEFAHELADKKLYEIRAMEELTEADFIRIYQKDYSFDY